MFKWNDATTDPVTGARSRLVRLSTDYNVNLVIAWNPENAGQNLFEMNEWMEEHLAPRTFPDRRLGPGYMPPMYIRDIPLAIREYGKSWRIWAREMVRLGCPINTVEHYIRNVLGGYIRIDRLIDRLFDAHLYTFRVRMSRRNGTVWSVSLTPIDTNGFAIPLTDPILSEP